MYIQKNPSLGLLSYYVMSFGCDSFCYSHLTLPCFTTSLQLLSDYYFEYLLFGLSAIPSDNKITIISQDYILLSYDIHKSLILPLGRVAKRDVLSAV